MLRWSSTYVENTTPPSFVDQDHQRPVFRTPIARTRKHAAPQLASHERGTRLDRMDSLDLYFKWVARKNGCDQDVVGVGQLRQKMRITVIVLQGALGLLGLLGFLTGFVLVHSVVIRLRSRSFVSNCYKRTYTTGRGLYLSFR